MQSRERVYEKREKRYGGLNLKQHKAASLLSNIRLVVFILGLAAAGTLYFSGLRILAAAAVIIAAAAFIYAAVRHGRVLDNKRYSEYVIKINADSLKRIRGQWKEFEDTGEEFLDKDHRFSYDLDLFGRGSLFQMISMAYTYPGRQALKKALLQPLEQEDKIYERQEAVAELAKLLGWRQRYASEGMAVSYKSVDPGFLYEWAGDKNEFYLKNRVRLILRIVPALTAVLLVSGFIGEIIPLYIPILMLAGQLAAIKAGAKGRGKILEAVCKYKDSIKVYERMIKRIETVKFTSGYLNKLKNSLINREGMTASKQLHKLSKLVDSISNRHNFFYVIFDIITLWDYQCLVALEDWKEQSGIYLKDWLHAVGELELLGSLALLAYDNDDWVMPEVRNKPVLFKASQLGHPLLGKRSVRNDLNFNEDEKVLLITGSNMSGKSTLLRTAGINLVLAYAGAPVCAKGFCCSLMKIYTCMRISDNLDKNISSFYAELLRIKMIVKSAGEGEPIFFLLDEIFKGTNSIDRHTGAKVLVKMLSGCTALGMVSTHDLELGELEKESKGIRNYHFREYYEKDEIHFDYKLQPGISKTRNAIYLMKLAGIDFAGKG